MPATSVVIASYNTAQLVGAAVKSVLGQTVRDLELIVIDDGSTDDTPEVLRPYASDPRFRYVRQDNQGQAAAKNRGIREARGMYVGFCDADDEWEPAKLERQLPAFDDPEIGVVYSREARFTEGAAGRRAADYTPEECHSGRVTEALFIENFVPFGTAMVRRSLLENVGGFDERYRMGIDWDLWLRLSLVCEFRYVDALTYHYRIWEQQMSSDWRGRYESAIRIMENFLAEHPGAVSPRTVRRAWAHTFVHRARSRVSRDKEYGRGLVDCARALLRDPGFAESWRTPLWIMREGWRATVGKPAVGSQLR